MAREQRFTRCVGLQLHGPVHSGAYAVVRWFRELIHEGPVARIVNREYTRARDGEVVLSNDEAREAKEGEVGLGEGPVGPLGFIYK